MGGKKGRKVVSGTPPLPPHTHLSGDLQRSPSGIFSADGELGTLVHQAAALLDPGPGSLDLSRNSLQTGSPALTSTNLQSTDLLWVAVLAVRNNQGHEGAVLNVHVVTGDVDGVLSGLRGPVGHVARAVVLVLALDLGLGRSLNGKAWRQKGPEGSNRRDVDASLLSFGTSPGAARLAPEHDDLGRKRFSALWGGSDTDMISPSMEPQQPSETLKKLLLYMCGLLKDIFNWEITKKIKEIPSSGRDTFKAKQFM